MPDLYSNKEMISAVRSFLAEKGFELRTDYDPTFDPARVPIFGYKRVKGAEPEEIFVDIITEQHIGTEFYFRTRKVGRIAIHPQISIPTASSAQFYRHYFPNARVFWAIPDYAEQKGGLEEFIKHCQEDHIGLLKITRTPKGEFTVDEIGDLSLPLLKERLNKIERDLANVPDSKQKETAKKNLEKSLRNWSLDDLAYLVFYPEPKYLAADISAKDEEYNISKNLANKMTELQKIAYRDVLSKFGKDYHFKAETDYDVAMKTTEVLWNRYDLEFPKLHREYEPVLKLDPNYRDHFLHAFQVFLFGAYIIDQLYDEIISTSKFGNRKGKKIEDAWLLAATYHDFNYVIEKFNKWTANFFKDALHLQDDVNPASIQLSEAYVRNGYMFKTKTLMDGLNIKVDDIILHFLYDRILLKKDHGLLSGLSLLKYLEKNKNKVCSRRVANAACKAICIHTPDIWGHLSGLIDDSDSNEIEIKFKRKRILERVSFREDPISFLLIFSDSIQEQGRESTPETKSELQYLYLKDNEIYSEISFSGLKSNEAFRSKINELERASKFLAGDNRFNIRISDSSTGQSHEFRI